MFVFSFNFIVQSLKVSELFYFYFTLFFTFLQRIFNEKVELAFTNFLYQSIVDLQCCVNYCCSAK